MPDTTLEKLHCVIPTAATLCVAQWRNLFKTDSSIRPDKSGLTRNDGRAFYYGRWYYKAKLNNKDLDPGYSSLRDFVRGLRKAAGRMRDGNGDKD
jgi:hypothetical protein